MIPRKRNVQECLMNGKMFMLYRKAKYNLHKFPVILHVKKKNHTVKCQQRLYQSDGIVGDAYRFFIISQI